MHFIFEPYTFSSKDGKEYFAVRISLINKDGVVLVHSYKPVMYITKEMYDQLTSK